MSPALLLPLGLAALAALAVPLVIHIARRSEQRPTDFAALRWLRQKPRPRQRLRFDEWPLLVARLVLLALLALWLARPVLFGNADEAPRVAVVPGVSLEALEPVRAERNRSTGLPTGQDSWPVLRLRSARTGEEVAIPPDAKVVWLAPGFPAIGTPPPIARAFPSLLRQLDAELPVGAKLIVVVPATLQGADAERPRLSRSVDWRVVAGAMPLAPMRKTALAMPAVRVDPAHAGALPYLRALAAAWQQSSTCSPSRLREGAGGWAPAISLGQTSAGRSYCDEAPANSLSPSGERVGERGSATGRDPSAIGRSPLPTLSPEGERASPALIWLATGPLPPAVTDWIQHGGTALVASDTQVDRTATTAFWRDDTSAPLVEGGPLGSGRLLRFTRRLAPAEMPQLLSPEFPAAMAKLLAPPAPPPARVAASDYAPVTGGLPPAPPARELQPWLALLIGLVLLAERWLATARRRGVAP